jgi:hypothetical protein
MLAFPVTQKRSVPRVSSLNDEPTQKSWLIIITNNMVKKRKRRKFQNYEPPPPRDHRTHGWSFIILSTGAAFRRHWEHKI